MHVSRKDLWISVSNEDYDRVEENTVAKMKKVQFATLTEGQEKIGLGYFLGEKQLKLDIEDKIMEKTVGKKLQFRKNQ